MWKGKRKISSHFHIFPYVLCYPKRKGVVTMDDKLQRELELINQNLNTIIKNQALIYERLGQVENAIKAPSSPGQE